MAGYQAWLKLHRYVKRGEHDLKIIVPMSKKLPSGEGEGERDLFFGTGTMFDITQSVA